jgi:hypothetical protein
MVNSRRLRLRNPLPVSPACRGGIKPATFIPLHVSNNRAGKVAGGQRMWPIGIIRCGFSTVVFRKMLLLRLPIIGEISGFKSNLTVLGLIL